MVSKNTESLLALRFLKGVGKKYLNQVSSSAEIAGISVESAFFSSKLGQGKFDDVEVQEAYSKAKEQIYIAEEMGHKIISKFDDEYPYSLKELQDAPPVLFCAGNLSILKENIVTVIGTRSPTEHGKYIAKKVTDWFVENNWIIASGLAKGIDTIAHKSCLERGGKTISVLAHGLEKIYPAENKALAEEIISSNGLLVTEYGYNSFVGKSNFVERDRIQAALAKAVLLVQSGLNGGSLHASRSIINYGRYLVVVGQSKTDVANQEPKIMANELLINGEKSQRLKLLQTDEFGLKKVLYLKDKTLFDEVDGILRGALYGESCVEPQHLNKELF